MGLAAMGFWLFLAAIIVAGIWYDAREKETKQETLRRIVESGHNIDAEVIERILGENTAKTLDRDLKVAAYITGSAGVGLGLLGLAIGRNDSNALSALMGVSGLVLCIGVGLFIAAKFAEKYDSAGA